MKLDEFLNAACTTRKTVWRKRGDTITRDDVTLNPDAKGDRVTPRLTIQTKETPHAR